MRKNRLILIISGAITLIITGIMNLLLFPIIEDGTAGMRFFDMNTTGYSVEACREFLSSLSVQGRGVALHIQLPLDFVYPVIYTVFFIAAIWALTGKKSKLNLLPLLLFITDYIENICSVKILNSSMPSDSIIKFASTVTLLKNILMYLIFGIIAVLFIIFLVKKTKEKQINK